jgi:hypothetical protein
VANRHLRLETGLFALTLTLVGAGCAGSQPKQSGEGDNFDQPPPNKESASPSASPSGSASADPTEGPVKWSNKASPKEDPLTEDQKAQMEIALRRGGEKASNCGSVVPDAKQGEGEVKVTFDGKKGRAVDVSVGPPWAGTPAEACIKRSFIGEIIVPFEGELEVPYTVKIGGKAEPAGKDAKGKDAKGKDAKGKDKKK